jgi:hypothetical protein
MDRVVIGRRIRRWLVSAIALCVFSCVGAALLWGRLMAPPAYADVRAMAEAAPLVFRGHVLSVIPPTESSVNGLSPRRTAKIQVDRWYKGEESTEILIPFRFPGEGILIQGHDCIDFQRGSYWIVFAGRKNGRVELFDDCHGALAISPRLGREQKEARWIVQMEADFLAGLDDPDPAARLVSIQRLGGLKLATSREALRRVIDSGDETESKWAVYAALRTGDITVLPRVKELLEGGHRKEPEGMIARELQDISDRRAIPDLLAILASAQDAQTRLSVLFAFAQVLKDPRTVPALGAHLSDSDRQARYQAMYGLAKITHEAACTLPPNWKEEDVEPQESQCNAWWERDGSHRSWPPIR